jgi:hypothetical protein
LTQKEINENKAEKNMFFMALTLCTISLVSRVLLLFCTVLFLFDSSFTVDVVVRITYISVQTIVPTLSIFVFYFFNKIFRQEFRRTFRQLKATANEPELAH